MTLLAAGLALTAAALHAGWNVAVKDAPDRLLGLWAIIVVAALLSAPFLVVLGPAYGEVPLLLAVSVVVHAAYDLLTAAAYDRVDLSVAYPLARGTAPALIAAGGVVLLGDELSPLGLAGVLGIGGGVVLLASGRADARGIAVALAGAVAVAAYTLLDSAAVRELGSSPRFVATLFPAHATVMTLVAWRLRGPAAMRRFVRAHPRRVLLTGVAAPTSYVLVLAAVRYAPVGLVAALRETSVVMAAGLGAWFLREPLTRRRSAAVAAILVGSVVLVSG